MKFPEYKFALLMLILFVVPYICIAIASSNVIIWIDTPEHRVIIWFITIASNIGYGLGHAFFFGFFSKLAREDYYKVPFEKDVMFGIICISLFGFWSGTILMFSYTHDMVIVGLALLVITFRFFMVAYFKSPYFDERQWTKPNDFVFYSTRKYRIFEFSHDLLIILHSAPEPLTFPISASSFTLILYPLGLTFEGVCGIFRGNTLLSRRIP